MRSRERGEPYNSTRLLSCRCKAGDLNTNAYVLEAMVRLSIPTDTGHYGFLIENLFEAEVSDQAVDFFR
ncbi:hypothetical protein FEM48_Zijuj11G0074300 [Ziziphus jujuba var. spinosa]|uniref:Uncharacterized protein n=1 Tax=Ziziphus jujuba var. spinosa TaxID=714518 RepID=A0A978UHM1_ZIZJJ|nr:hypothetical protein FEM48_Zijuj11G0074300 [Ziziphus jujuba var. spinosa]